MFTGHLKRDWEDKEGGVRQFERRKKGGLLQGQVEKLEEVVLVAHLVVHAQVGINMRLTRETGTHHEPPKPG